MDWGMGLYQNLLQTRIFSSFAGDLKGKDSFGNTYYQERLLFGKPQRALKRWVLYANNRVEGSTIPPQWFGWLHYTSELPLKEGRPYAWTQEHDYNKTGGDEAYHPTQSLLNEDPKPPHAGYTPWHPSKKK
jgi:NADH:ubiquinone oxidoreductase subunit